MKNYTKKMYAQKGSFNNRARYARKRALKFGVKGSFTRKSIENLYVKQLGRCACCGEILHGKFDVDHIIPLSKGGSNFPENLQLLKPSCNNSKSSKTMEEYLNG